MEKTDDINENFSKSSVHSDATNNEQEETDVQPSTSNSFSKTCIDLKTSGKNEKSPLISELDSESNIDDYIKVMVPKEKMAEKLAASRPYNYFLTCITSSPATHNEPLSITFQEIFDPSLGDLESSVQINFVVEENWLLGQYYFAGHIDKPLLILYGWLSGTLPSISEKHPQISAHFIKPSYEIGIHHTKMMLLAYKDGSMRVVVSTANLYEDDWHNRTQGLWISEKLDPLPHSSEKKFGESPTKFRNDLLIYLSCYKLPQLQPWLTRIRKTNFASVNVFLVTSIPGIYNQTSTGYPHGHGRIAYLLAKHSAKINNDSPVVAQASSLGNFGRNKQDWLCGEFLKSFCQGTKIDQLEENPELFIIYPSHNNVENSHDGLLGGGCLPYQNRVHKKQRWLNHFLYQWRADRRHRSQAMPHIKTYCRWRDNKLFWFILTSANLSKSGWGFMTAENKKRVIRNINYEAGVVFFPKFVTKTHYFSMDESDSSTLVFPLLYDIPLTKYTPEDNPFVIDVLST
ncbi:probable tyrosyl-DNA phosphodiesterase [Contarinia nasturtii]|uniref:probable tyrosyl-DNA phosphodiesterase n=1 Tax=Contarinia nasturtii TaxID=265458 RepID=UPI0012D43016|nr:probable tyrosyl-DNA phosphodiesterase [Contarinia nasturtii]